MITLHFIANNDPAAKGSATITSKTGRSLMQAAQSGGVDGIAADCGGMLTCATCHGTNTNAKIIDYDHAKPVAGVKCVYCHYKNQTVTSAAVETKSHESTSNTKDCNVSGCHRPSSYPSWNATSKTFSGGSWGEP